MLFRSGKNIFWRKVEKGSQVIKSFKNELRGLDVRRDEKPWRDEKEG